MFININIGFDMDYIKAKRPVEYLNYQWYKLQLETLRPVGYESQSKL